MDSQTTYSPGQRSLAGTFRPIGRIRTPFAQCTGMPVQGAVSGVEGTVELEPELEAGLTDIEGFSHLILLYAFSRSAPEVPLLQRPLLEETEHGVFAIRSPVRPNPIGLTVVRLLGREGCVLRVRGVDMLDGTPLLDIKPYVARFDAPEGCRCGWLEPHLDRVAEARADDRFWGGSPGHRKRPLR
jgi:tRNA-Thr(GGU) m(6)t(6)A37 methyltransferase TsaA